MKRLINIALILGMLTSFGPAAAKPVQLKYQNETGMPGWPTPGQPVPHHEAGQPFRSGNATYQATRLNAQGEKENVELRGLDALLANGTLTDPLQGNYQLVGLDKIMFSSYAYNPNNLSVKSFEFVTPTLSMISTSTVNYDDMRFNAIATGDLNGDFVDEQITAWVNPTDKEIYMNIGELPGADGKAISAPAVIAHANGSLDVLVRGYDYALWHLYYNGATWESWNNNPGGILLSSPAVASRASGELDAFAVGMDNQVYHNHKGEGWDSWTLVDCGAGFPELEQVVPLPNIPAPAVAARSGSQLDLFRKGPDNTLRWCHFNGSAWGTWQNLGGMLASSPGAVSLGDGRMQVYALGMDSALWYRTYNGSVWGTWQRLETPDGVAVDTPPVLTSPAAGEVAVYLAGSENNIWTIQHNGSVWGTWDDYAVVGGDLGSGIGAAAGPAGTHLFVNMSDGSLRYSQDGASWTPMEWLDVSVTFDTGENIGIEPLPDVTELENYILDITTGYFTGDGRQQVALAYVINYSPNSWSQLNLIIYDIQNGFKLVPIAQLQSPMDYCYFPRIAAGDVDGNGIDEIGLAYSWVGYDWINLKIFDIQKDQTGNPTGFLSEVYDAGGLSYAGWAFAGTLRIAAGDIVPDPETFSPNDEFTIVTDWRRNISGSSRQLYCALHLYNHDTGTFTEKENRFIQATNGADYPDMYATGIGLAVGDVNGRVLGYGNDEVVVLWPLRFSSSVYPRLDMDLIVWSYKESGVFEQIGKITLIPFSRYTFLDTIAIGDVDLDMKNEIVVAINQDNPTHPYLLSIYEYPLLGPVSSYDLSYGSVPRAFNLALGDFTGESIRVGPPTYRVQSQMTTPVVFLNMPPEHRDIIEVDGVDTVIKVTGDVYAKHIGESGGGEVYESVSKREWALSTGYEMGVGGGGAKVTTSLSNTYGQNFQDSITKIQDRQITDETTASIYDQVIYNATNYAVWEYPVYGVLDGNPDEAKTISVVFPLVEDNNMTNQPSTLRSTWCDENFYTPSHQIYNVWSYDHTAVGKDGFKDLHEIIISKSTSGGTTITMRMSESGTAARSASFHNQISAGLEFSYKSELNIPLIGKAWDFSFRAYANGSYGHEELSTFTSQVKEATGVEIHYPENLDFPNITAYLYWTKGGYMVVDYQTAPDTPHPPWSYYNKPDPAFTLPWYGFPDPANPVDPLCGNDKKLFTHDIELDPAYVQNGDTVIITATVRNFSPVATTNVKVGFYLGDPSSGGVAIGNCTIASLDRTTGPGQCSTTWVVSGGSGDEKIFAVIDPDDLPPYDNEMHDMDDVINNNIGYGLLHVASGDYFDPGLRNTQTYQTILYEDAPGLGFGLYLPTANITETMRYELVPTSIGGMNIVGNPIQVLAFSGGEQYPATNFNFGDIPAGMIAQYRDTDLPPGMNEANLKLYRLEGSTWIEATCTGYEVVRFPQGNRLAVPICQTGTFILSDKTPLPLWKDIYLPLISR
jgi:hypothetical protein